MSTYPRDIVGYGRQPLQATWPGGARVAINFVINYEEGGEVRLRAIIPQLMTSALHPTRRHKL